MSALSNRITEVLRAHMVCACGNTGEDMECCSYVAERVVEALQLTEEIGWLSTRNGVLHHAIVGWVAGEPK